MNDIIFMILETILAASVMAIMRYLIPFLIRGLRAHDFNFAADLVEVAVRAAEQIFDGAGRGSEKYEFVKKHLLEELLKYHITLSEEQLNQLIEAAVQAMNQEGQWLESAEAVTE